MKSLTNDQFMALRAMAKERWSLGPRSGSPVLWKFHRQWYYIYADGFRERFEQSPSVRRQGGYTDAYNRAQKAAQDLEDMGLAKVELIYRCCPGKQCHNNDNYGVVLTERGRGLLDRASEETSLRVTQDENPGFESGVGARNSWLTKALSVIARVY